MRFSLHLESTQKGQPARRTINPFTGEPIEGLSQGRLTDGDRNAVRSLLTGYGASEPDEETYCRITLSNGSEIQIALGTLNDDAPCSAFAVECPDASLEVCRFLFEFAKNAHLSIGSTIDPDVKIIASASPNESRKEIVNSAEPLQLWIQERLGDTIV